MAQQKTPASAQEFSKSSKFFWVFKCNKKMCEGYTASSKSSSPRMIGQDDLLKMLSGEPLPVRYGNIHKTQKPDKTPETLQKIKKIHESRAAHRS